MLSIIKCNLCDKEFETDKSNKKYCSLICSYEVKRINHKKYQRVWSRKRRGMYLRWANFLKEEGWIVISPKEAIKISKEKLLQ